MCLQFRYKNLAPQNKMNYLMTTNGHPTILLDHPLLQNTTILGYKTLPKRKTTFGLFGN